VVDNGTDLRGHEHDVIARDVGEDLEGPDDVEHREVRIQRKRDLHGASSGLEAFGRGAEGGFTVALGSRVPAS
jgi:hypothetical protein